jgi:uncharacterized protein
MNKLASFFWLLAAWLALAAGAVHAGEVIPAKPTRYFNDYALATSTETADRLNRQLEAFERETSNQIIVVVFPRMLTDSSLEDYTQRVFRAWQIGQTGRNNGAVLFVFLENRKLRIQTGFGLEGALPDAVCKQIIADQIAPKFKAGDYDGGLSAGVAAIMQAAKGEYKGTGRTVLEQKGGNARANDSSSGFGIIFFLVIAFFVFQMFNRNRGRVYNGRGSQGYGGGVLPIPFGGFGGGGSGGFSSGSSGGSDGGGFFASGGGDSGGGGASGDW